MSIFQDIFYSIVNKCIEIGIVKGNRILTDSTLIQANASLGSLCPKNQGDLITIRNQQEKKVSNETHISRTDPEASLAVKRNKVRALRYKVHNAIDADSRIILDSKKTTGACHDSVPFLSQLEEVESRYSLEIKEVVADRAYGSGSILVQLEQKNIKAFIPLFNTITGRTYDLEKEGFKFDPNKDVYLCPENKICPHIKAKIIISLEFNIEHLKKIALHVSEPIRAKLDLRALS